MATPSPIKPYQRDFDISYTFGAFPTMELLLTHPQIVRSVYVHPDFRDEIGLEELCRTNAIPMEKNQRVIERVSRKGNCYVLGVFNKCEGVLQSENSHVLLVNPADMGNLGTIMRTCVGFGICDLALIEPCADGFDPRVIRSSMGACFKIRTQRFASYEAYVQAFSARSSYAFMSDAPGVIQEVVAPKGPYTLIFGNEAAGLDESFRTLAQAVSIPQSADVDSLNLSIAVGIGVFYFSQVKG